MNENRELLASLFTTIKRFRKNREFKETINKVWCDGRHFRRDYPMGYIGMSCLHGLDYSYEDKSDKFKKVVECLTYPEYAFTDWN